MIKFLIRETKVWRKNEYKNPSINLKMLIFITNHRLGKQTYRFSKSSVASINDALAHMKQKPEPVNV